MVMRDGTPIEKASYAYPEVRGLMLSIIRESMTTFDADGANLCFVRGTEFVLYRQPVLDDFRKTYGADARKFNFSDPRLMKLRGSYITQFVRDARRVLDEVGAKKGKRLELSAWVFPELDRNRRNGTDVESWIKAGLLDSVITLWRSPRPAACESRQNPQLPGHPPSIRQVSDCGQGFGGLHGRSGRHRGLGLRLLSGFTSLVAGHLPPRPSNRAGQPGLESAALEEKPTQEHRRLRCATRALARGLLRWITRRNERAPIHRNGFPEPEQVEDRGRGYMRRISPGRVLCKVAKVSVPGHQRNLMIDARLCNQAIARRALLPSDRIWARSWPVRSQ